MGPNVAAYKEVITTAVGGAAGVIHAVDSAVIDCQPNANVEALRVFLVLVSKIKRKRRVHLILTDPPHYLVTHKRCVVTPQGFKPWTFRTGI